jgi:hypothetical protein
MNRVRLSALRAAAVAIIAALPLLAAPALANAAGPSTFTLVLFSPDGHSASARTLTCDPDGGSIADPKLACDELRAVNGDFDKLMPDRQVLCAKHVDPIEAIAVGWWHGCRIAWASGVFPNLCELQRRTGSVFRF